jgi:hypothetical protein
MTVAPVGQTVRKSRAGEFTCMRSDATSEGAEPYDDQPPHRVPRTTRSSARLFFELQGGCKIEIFHVKSVGCQ